MPPRREGTIAVAVVDGGKDVARRVVRFADGEVVAEVDGGEVGDADVLLTLTPADAEAVVAGTLDLSVAFMRGTMKMRGDRGLLLHALPVLAADPAAAMPG